MVTLFRVVFVAVWLFNAAPSFAWNALGHRLVAQIAYDALSSADRRRVTRANQALNTPEHCVSFVNAAPWLDYIHDRRIWGMKASSLHYIDIPFSFDHTPLKSPAIPNALTAVDYAAKYFNDADSSNFDQGLSVRILTHVIADLHQPLHAADQFSDNYPDGDRGGNLFKLGRNPVAPSLHAYWDRGGGWLLSKKRVTNRALRAMANELEKKWPCALPVIDKNPATWAQASHQIAVKYAYSIKRLQIPSMRYQVMVQGVSQQQIALAGCRLASYFAR